MPLDPNFGSLATRKVESFQDLFQKSSGPQEKGLALYYLYRSDNHPIRLRYLSDSCLISFLIRL